MKIGVRRRVFTSLSRNMPAKKRKTIIRSIIKVPFSVMERRKLLMITGTCPYVRAYPKIPLNAIMIIMQPRSEIGHGHKHSINAMVSRVLVRKIKLVGQRFIMPQSRVGNPCVMIGLFAELISHVLKMIMELSASIDT